MRLFIAINPTSEERARLAEAARELRESDYGVRWVPPENVHLTLKFLGEVQEQRVAELSSGLGEAVKGRGPFKMAVSGFGAFPSPSRPQVVWAGVTPSSTLRELHEAIEEATALLGFERETRSFHPHLTLGRAQRRARPAEFGGLDELIGRLAYEDAYEVHCVDLMRSTLRPSGALYDVIHRMELVSQAG
ncbi:MAG: RNA 2',3'-cyclic phosphodiesterase [Gemmatimonadota bacterium]|nr:MAG: RNA 2',3'-cyclic phosphodiesterase [Gemmatimonadota bacterium]